MRAPSSEPDLAHLAAVVDAAGDAIIATTLEGTVTLWNRAAETLFGRAREEVIGRSTASLAGSPDQADERREIYRRVGAGEVISGVETTIRRRDGTIVEVSVSLAPIRDGEGHVVGASVSVRDLTAQRVAETARRRESDLLAEAEEIAGLGSWEIDLVRGHTFGSPRIHAIYGLDSPRLRAGDPSELRALIHPDDHDGHLAMLERVTASGEAEERDFRIRRPDGQERTLHTRARRSPDATRLLGTVQDVTENRHLERELRQARDRIAGLLDAASETMIIATDATGTITVFNRGAERLFGHRAEDLVGRSTPVILHDRDEMLARARELGIEPGIEVFNGRARDGRAETREWTMYHRDGTRLTVALTISPQLDEHGELVAIIGVGHDLTATRAAERARGEAERRFSAAFAHAPIGIALVGLTPGDRGRILQANPALAAIVGRRDPSEFIGRHVDALRHPEDVGRSADNLARLLAGETVESEQRALDREGTELWLDISTTPVPDESGTPVYAVSQIVDVSERKRLERRLQHLADHDALTGVLNRRRFDSELRGAIRAGRRDQRSSTLLMLDLNGFKAVNDTYGHAAGDELIARVGETLRGSVRGSDVVARIGGDEFAVILRDTVDPEASRIADTLRARVAELGRTWAGRREGAVTTAIGRVDVGPDTAGAEALLAAVDAAMYADKSAMAVTR